MLAVAEENSLDTDAPDFEKRPEDDESQHGDEYSAEDPRPVLGLGHVVDQYVAQHGRHREARGHADQLHPKQELDTGIGYRCDNRRFWLSAHNCQVSTPTSQNLELEQQIRIFGGD